MNIRKPTNTLILKSLMLGVFLIFLTTLFVTALFYFISNRTADVYVKSLRVPIITGDLKELKILIQNTNLYFKGVQIEIIDLKQTFTSGQKSILSIKKNIFYDSEKSTTSAYIYFYLDINFILVVELCTLIFNIFIVFLFHKKLNKELIKDINLKNEKMYLQRIDDVSKQVAHDIRSPISTLKLLSNKIRGNLEAEYAELFSAAISRIEDISNDLLDGKSIQQFEEFTKISFKDILKIIDDKKINIQNTNIKIEFKTTTYSSYLIGMRLIDFDRILSNIINNSIEAVDINNGLIEIDFFEENGYIYIKIADNGKGIPSEFLSKVGNKGFTIDKKNGHGLGLSHAKMSIQQANGRLEISSKFKFGTIITISLIANSYN